MSDQLEAMTAAAAAAAMRHLVKGEIRTTGDNHYQATRAGGPPVDQLHLVCGLPACGQSVACLSYDTAAGSFVYTLEQLTALIGAHVLQCHNGAAASL